MPSTWIGSAIRSASSEEFIAHITSPASEVSHDGTGSAVLSNAQFDLRAAPGLHEVHGATVTLDDLGHDGESQAGATGVACARRVQSHEALEEPFTRTDVDADAVIGHRDHGVLAVVV